MKFEHISPPLARRRLVRRRSVRQPSLFQKVGILRRAGLFRRTRPAAATPSAVVGRAVDENLHRQALETGRNRLIVTGVLFALAFLVIGGRLVELAVLPVSVSVDAAQIDQAPELRKSRADVYDRNGLLLATSLPTASLYANPQHILDVDEAVRKLVSVLPALDPAEVRERLSSDKSFVWLYRNLTPKQKFAVNTLGVPGLNFQTADRRVYPHGAVLAHVLGLTDVDDHGLAGVEAYFDDELRKGGTPLYLSIDLRVQAILRHRLMQAVDEFSAIGGAGLIMDARTGEIIAMTSLPDFDPNQPETMSGAAGFNRVTKGVYEMGSTFKLFTAAMALDSGAATLADRYDATHPIHIARFTISDYHALNRWLTVPEILIHSSNIGAAKMALDVGTATQREYLGRFGLLRPVHIELPETGAPLMPHRWREINTMTISYGHGIAVSPLHVAAGVAALVDGGVYHTPTLLRGGARADGEEERVLKRETSDKMRALMRLVVRDGTGKKANVPGYRVGGKTGSADKLEGRSYRAGELISSFVATFPTNAPRFVILALLDEPKGTRRTHGYATGGWVAAPVVGDVVRRIAPLLGMEPNPTMEADTDLGKPSPRPARNARQARAETVQSGMTARRISVH